VPAHGLAPQNLSSDKHVDGCADSDEDRGSTPLASSLKALGTVAAKRPLLPASEEFLLIQIPNSQFARADLILKSCGTLSLQ